MESQTSTVAPTSGLPNRCRGGEVPFLLIASVQNFSISVPMSPTSICPTPSGFKASSRLDIITYTQTHIHTHTHTCMHACIYTHGLQAKKCASQWLSPKDEQWKYMYNQTLTPFIYTYIRTYVPTSHMQAYINYRALHHIALDYITWMHTYIHTYLHTYIRAVLQNHIV